MQPRQLYAVAVRILGLVFLMYALFGLLHMAAKLIHVDVPSTYSVEGYLAMLVGNLAIFVGVTIGAEWVVDLAYGQKRSPGSPELDP